MSWGHQQPEQARAPAPARVLARVLARVRVRVRVQVQVQVQAQVRAPARVLPWSEVRRLSLQQLLVTTTHRRMNVLHVETTIEAKRTFFSFGDGPSSSTSLASCITPSLTLSEFFLLGIVDGCGRRLLTTQTRDA